VGSSMDSLFYWLGAVVFFWSLVCLAFLLGIAAYRRGTSPRPRRGGYVKPPASSGQSRGIPFTTPLIQSAEGYSSSSTARGSLSAEEATRLEQAWGNRYSALIDCGCAEAGSPGLPRQAADSEVTAGVTATGEATARYVGSDGVTYYLPA
jgi:hypothetical protein